MYQSLERYPKRGTRFANNMKAYMLMEDHSPSHVVNNYDWGSLGEQFRSCTFPLEPVGGLYQAVLPVLLAWNLTSDTSCSI